MHGCKYDFLKFVWGGAHRAPPQTPSPRSISGFAVDSRALCVLGSGCALNSPLQYVWYPLSQPRGTRPNTVHCFPQTPTFWLHHRPNISFQDNVVGLIEIYQWKISLTAGWEDFLKIQRDERVILEHTILGNICTRSFHFSPECTKIVSGWGSAPDPARGAYSATPDPLAVMGWDGDLVTTFLGCKLCAPLLVAGAPLLFWGWLRAWYQITAPVIGLIIQAYQPYYISIYYYNELGLLVWLLLMTTTLASFDVKLILFDFRNQTSAWKYFILKIFQSHILKIILLRKIIETLRKTWKLQRSDYAMWVVKRRFLA